MVVVNVAIVVKVVHHAAITGLNVTRAITIPVVVASAVFARMETQ